MILFLNKSEVKVLRKGHLPCQPKWALKNNFVDLGLALLERSESPRRTIGSEGWLWSDLDRVLFDADSLGLVGCRFRVPGDRFGRASGVPDILKSADSCRGRLQLSHREDFELESTDWSCIDLSSSALVCGMDELPSAQGDCLRVVISEYFELVFVDGSYCGWILNGSERWIVSSLTDDFEETEDGDLLEQISIYMDLVSEPNIELIEDGDEQALGRLKDLYRSVWNCDEPSDQRKVFSRCLEEVAETLRDEETAEELVSLRGTG